MEPTFAKYILRHSWRQQLFLLLLTVASFPFLYYSLELPKLIVNDAIGATEFTRTFIGFELEQIDYLLALCFAFLALVFVRFALRYYLNVYKGILAERILRRLRYQLVNRVLRFPLPHFRKASQGEIIAMTTAEVEPLGGFVGEAVALPAFEGGTMLTILIFMFMQDWVLGLAAISLIPFQIYVIPKLQRQVNALAKQRVRTVRKLSERIGEVVTNIESIHANDTSELERADISNRLATIYDIRFRIYKKKFLIKFINNFVGQLTPFFFFSIGGYLIITGRLTFGALVAVLAAYKDLSAPWKELLNWYQMKEDSRVKYDQLVEQFDPPGLLDESLQTPVDGEVPHLQGLVVASNLCLEEEGGLRVVDGVSFTFDVGEKVALVGAEGSGVGALSKLLARLLIPTSGTIRIDGLDLTKLPEAVTGRRIGYVGQGATPLDGTVRDNLLYALKHQPVAPGRYEGDAVAARERFVHEAREAGNTESDPNADWIDYAAAGVADGAALMTRAIEVLGQVDLERDIFAFGLLSTFDPKERSDLADRILEARAMLRRRLTAAEYADLVETFDRNRYNFNMSVAENLLFGTPIGPEFDLEHIAENAYMLSVLEKSDLKEEFLKAGLQAARIMVDLFRDVRPGDQIFERFSFISADALPDYQAVVRRADAGGLDGLSAADRTLIMALPFKLVPARHRLGILTKEIEQRLLEARHAFAAGLPDSLKPAVAFFDEDRYNAAASVQDNILFGRLVYGRPQSQKLVGELLGEVIAALDLRRAVIELGLDFSVGIGGSRLSAAQRQKLALARTILKRPELLILDQATAALDVGSHRRIKAHVLADAAKAGVVWVMNDASETDGFDRLLVMENGRISAQRTLEETPAEDQDLNTTSVAQ